MGAGSTTPSESRKTIFNQTRRTVEIEIRGDFIVDCNGQTVDANAIGLSPAPTGNGTPGGTFFSTFRVHHHAIRVRDRPMTIRIELKESKS